MSTTLDDVFARIRERWDHSIVASGDARFGASAALDEAEEAVRDWIQREPSNAEIEAAGRVFPYNMRERVPTSLRAFLDEKLKGR